MGVAVGSDEQLKIEYLSTDALIPYARNPRKNDHAVDSVAASIKEFGFKVPIVVDAEGVIVTGHTRVKAAKKLGMGKVPAIRAGDLSKEQIKAFRILDNKVAEKSEWDPELLPLELAEITIDLAPFDVEFEEEIQPNIIDQVSLPDGAGNNLQAMSFIVSNEQAETIRRAIDIAKEFGEFGDTGNENGNGNSLGRIAELFILWAAQKTS